VASYNFFLNLFQKFLHNLGLFMTDWISRLPRLIFQCKHINEFVFFSAQFCSYLVIFTNILLLQV